MFRDMDAAEYQLARKLVIHAIIHTDMCKHFPMVENIKKWPESAGVTVPDPEDRCARLNSRRPRAADPSLSPASF